MFETLQTKPMLGTGIYTVPDIAMILGLPYSKINRWLTKFWNDKLGSKYSVSYSWNIDLTKAVNFYTLIELYTFYQLNQEGVSAKEILKSHETLSKDYNTPYPFANKVVLEGLRTDGKRVIFERTDGVIYNVDEHKQTYLAIIKDFFKNLEFGDDSIVSRIWPLGKDKSIVCDPHHKFGQPIISGTNIQAEAIYRMYQAKEPIRFIASLYEINQSKVKDAILFCKKAS